jgi:hypothetical protein
MQIRIFYPFGYRRRLLVILKRLKIDIFKLFQIKIKRMSNRFRKKIMGFFYKWFRNKILNIKTQRAFN